MMSWSENIWERGMPQYERILRHPFLRGLADGTLAPERFARYMAQDELYLPAYCSLMHRLAGLMPDEDDRNFMHTFADAGGESEREMHFRLIERFCVNTDVQPSAVTKGYRSFLEAAIDGGDAATATAAMLPCSWVYNNVGLHVGEIAELEGNPYRESIPLPKLPAKKEGNAWTRLFLTLLALNLLSGTTRIPATTGTLFELLPHG